jgi:hypothetical protein
LPVKKSALTWMMWFDEWNTNPPTVCPACHKVFRPLSLHKMKYCSYPCAHRIAMQKCRQRKRESKIDSKMMTAKKGSFGQAIGSRAIQKSQRRENQLLKRGFSKELLDSCRGRSNAGCDPPDRRPLGS